MPWQSELALAEEAARKAGARLLDGFGKEQSVLAETPGDIKLQADRDAEATIMEHLAVTGFPVLAEESGIHGEIKEGEPAWIIDPLDGTMNYSRGVPQCAVSIGLSLGDQPVAGVIFDFTRDEMFSGIVGEGAHLNGQPIRVSKATRPDQVLFVTGFSARVDFEKPDALEVVQYARRFRKIRMPGTAAIMLAYVAAGRYDAYAEFGTMFWDIAGGVALVAAAGGYTEHSPYEQNFWQRNIRCSCCREIWP